MPQKYICRHIGCNVTIDHKGYCEMHEPMHEEFVPGTSHRPPASWASLYRSARWRALRAKIIKRDGGCVVCGHDKGLVVDHIIPHRGNEELFYDEENLQTLCAFHHRIKTDMEIRQRKRSG